MSQPADSRPFPFPEKKYIIDGMIPIGELSMIAGTSGAGKTTLALQWLYDFVRGLPVLGRASHPGPVLYLACDRSLASVGEVFKRTQVDPYAFKAFSMMDLENLHSVGQVLKWVADNYPETKLLFIEMLGNLVPDGKVNDYKIVSDFGKQIISWARRHEMAVMGTTHFAKAKERDGYKNFRDKMLGSAAWSAILDTVVTIESTHPEDVEDDGRVVRVQPRNGKASVHQMTFTSDGRLVDLETDVEQTLGTLLDAELFKLPSDGDIRTSAFVEMGARMNISESTTKRWLASACDRALLRKSGKGIYRVEQIN